MIIQIIKLMVYFIQNISATPLLKNAKTPLPVDVSR